MVGLSTQGLTKLFQQLERIERKLDAIGRIHHGAGWKELDQNIRDEVKSEVQL